VPILLLFGFFTFQIGGNPQQVNVGEYMKVIKSLILKLSYK